MSQFIFVVVYTDAVVVVVVVVVDSFVAIQKLAIKFGKNWINNICCFRGMGVLPLLSLKVSH